MAEEGQQEKKKIVSVDEQRAAEGMKLFQGAGEAKIEFDTEGAQKFTDETNAAIKALEEEVKTLTGKDNKKARTEKSKELSNMKNDPKFIDAGKVLKGLEPKNGNFMKKIEAAPKAKPKEEKPKEEEKAKEDKAKKPKKDEGAGISKDERQELEDLKKKIIDRKTQLKAEGMSGGAQNKDEQVSGMVKRMNELKEKEAPGSTAKGGKDKSSGSKKKGALSSDEQKEFDALKNQIEEYRGRLTSEFGYSKKEIKADPEMQELEEKSAAFVKRGGT